MSQWLGTTQYLGDCPGAIGNPRENHQLIYKEKFNYVTSSEYLSYFSRNLEVSSLSYWDLDYQYENSQGIKLKSHLNRMVSMDSQAYDDSANFSFQC